MHNTNRLFRLFLILAVVFSGKTALSLAEPIVLVDKSKYELHLAHEKNGLEIFKTFPITIGKNTGDKMVEGDLKTPEGIYLFTEKFAPPQIKKKFGAMAFYIDYPNSIDKKDGKTGFDIMLHSTDDPKRLEKPQDSDGCVVVNDDRIKEISSYIHPLKTKIIIYDQLKPEYLHAASTDGIKKTFENWIRAWSTKDLESYIGMYAENFTFNNLNKEQYKEYKSLLNKKYHSIQVTASNVQVFYHPKYSLVSFSQEYLANYESHRVAFKTKSLKKIYFARENGSLKIIHEGN